MILTLDMGLSSVKISQTYYNFLTSKVPCDHFVMTGSITPTINLNRLNHLNTKSGDDICDGCGFIAKTPTHTRSNNTSFRLAKTSTKTNPEERYGTTKNFKGSNWKNESTTIMTVLIQCVRTDAILVRCTQFALLRYRQCEMLYRPLVHDTEAGMVACTRKLVITSSDR